MTKQEEIREGIKSEIIRGLKHNGSYENIAKEILFYLHSQGVVIKVDRELPKRHIRTGPGIFHWFPQTEDKAEAQQDMLRAGYEAVEPLQDIEKEA